MVCNRHVSLSPCSSPSHQPTPRSARRSQLRLEALEDRWLPSTTTVTNLLDSGPGSLRDALLNTPANGTVDFQPGLTGTITLSMASGTLDIAKNLTIVGPGASILAVSGGNDVQIFTIEPGSTVTISGLSIRNGEGALGAGIYNAGNLTLADSMLSNGTTSLAGGGGAIFNTGTMTVTGSTLSGNTTDGNGGAIYNAGALALTNDTLTGNTAQAGGAIADSGPLLSLMNVTIAGNSTIPGGSGGGLYISAGDPVTMVNTIVATNSAYFGPDITGAVTTASHDLLGNNTGSSGVVQGVDGNLVGTAADPLDPKVGTLKNNVGPTPTRALLAGSPAIDAGTNTGAPTVDQRGFKRPVNNITDMGAYEYQPPGTTTVAVVNPNPSTVNQPVAITATVSADAPGSSTPTGTVSFYDGTTLLGIMSLNTNGTATYATALLQAGNHPITATYNGFTQGDFHFSSSTSLPMNLIVNKDTVVVALASSPNPAWATQSVTFTTVVSAGGTGNIVPGGTVTFYDGGTALATVTLNAASTATWSTAALSVGTHSITAHYNGDSNFLPGVSSAKTQEVQALVTSATLNSSPNPVQIHQAVTFQATVQGVLYNNPTPTGTVTFYDGGTALATVNVSGGSAAYATSNLTAGNHTITAHYNGDSLFAASTSTSVLEHVRAQSFFAVGGAPGHVRVYNPDNTLVVDFAPYGPNYTGSINVAVGDISGDGYPDIVTAAAVGNPDVRVYDGKAFATGTFNPANPDLSLLAQFFPYALQFNVGATVAVGDVSGDGYCDLITGADVGNPDVRVYSGKDIATHNFNPNGSSLLAQWFPYALQFNVGANVAVGDIEHDGYADIVTGATVGNPDVRVYSGKDIANHTFNPGGSSLMAQWFAYGLNFNVGATVAVGDANGDGYADVITGASAGNPDVHVYDGQAIANRAFNSAHPETQMIDQFFAYDLNFNIGVNVGSADFENNGHFDILTGASAGAPHYRVVKGTATGVYPPAMFEGIPTDLEGGIAVGA
jgi:hypothetical protein